MENINIRQVICLMNYCECVEGQFYRLFSNIRGNSYVFAPKDNRLISVKEVKFKEGTLLYVAIGDYLLDVKAPVFMEVKEENREFYNKIKNSLYRDRNSFLEQDFNKIIKTVPKLNQPPCDSPSPWTPYNPWGGTGEPYPSNYTFTCANQKGN